AEARQRLVDGVVDDLVHHVVQTRAVIGITDVHAGAFAHGFEALEDLDALFVVFARRGRRGGLVAVLGSPAARRIDRRGHRFSRRIEGALEPIKLKGYNYLACWHGSVKGNSS